MGGGLREGGGGGGAGEGVAGYDSNKLGHRRWRPGKGGLSLSNFCLKHLRSTCRGWKQRYTMLYHLLLTVIPMIQIQTVGH